MTRNDSYSNTKIFVQLLLPVMAVITYIQTIWHPFIQSDFTEFLRLNPNIGQNLSWENVLWAFKTTYDGSWKPAVWMTHLIEFRLFGVSPLALHLNNIILHSINTYLVFHVLNQITDSPGRSALATGLFAVHPLHVEAIVSIAQRDDLLCAFFWMLTTLTYLRYIRKGGYVHILLAAILMALGLLANPVIAVLPFIFLVWDYYPFSRKAKPKWLLIEKLPLFVLSASAGFMALQNAVQNQQLVSLEAVSLPARFANAFISIMIYLSKTFWPRHLSYYYPHPGEAFSATLLGTAIALVAVITVLVYHRRKESPHFFAGWCWFLIALFPHLGFFQSTGRAMADHYTYIPHIGLFLTLVCALPKRWTVHIKKCLGCGGSVFGYLIVLMILSSRQVGFWSNTESLNKHALDVNPGNYYAHKELGYYFLKKNDYGLAHYHLKTSLSLWTRVFSKREKMIQEKMAADIETLEKTISAPSA